MAESNPLLRQRRCRAEECGAVFWICRACDRGQTYCGPVCRQRQRRRQCRAANQRHQQSPEGRADHRDRQRAYRQRLRQARVTDQRRQTVSVSVTLNTVLHLNWEAALKRALGSPEEPYAEQLQLFSVRTRAVCIRCGRRAGFIDPFHGG